MNEEDIQQVPPTTPNLHTDVARKLADLLPEVVADGKIDVAALQAVLGNDAATGTERFGLFWPGKTQAIRAAQTPTTATLAPDRDNSLKLGHHRQCRHRRRQPRSVETCCRSTTTARSNDLQSTPPYNTWATTFVLLRTTMQTRSALTSSVRVSLILKENFRPTPESDGRFPLQLAQHDVSPAQAGQEFVAA